MKKTYVEAFRQKRFDWNLFLHRKNISEASWENAHSLSCSFITCACGNLSIRVPRDPNGAPHDEILTDLGVLFNTEILARDVTAAKSTLIKIKKRSDELLNKIETASIFV